MKLTPLVMTVLTACAKINPHIVIDAGNVIRTVNPKKTMLFSAVVDVEFEGQIRLADLPNFLKILKLFDDPDIVVKERSLVISDGSSSQEYYMADSADLIYDQRDVQFPAADFEFDLPSDELEKVKSAAGVLGVEDILICGEGGRLVLKALNVEKPKRVHTVNTTSEITGDGDFNVHLKHSRKLTRLEMLKLDYHVMVNRRKIIQFVSELDGGAKITYFMAAERDSEI